MTRIEKIRQMTDEELAEFLYEVTIRNGTAELLVPPDTLRRMPDAEVANLLERMDRRDRLHTCTDNCPPDYSPGIKNQCAECALIWLLEEGPLMDGEGE